MPSDAMDHSQRHELVDPLSGSNAESISRDELRGLVRDWTARLKEQGLPPERVLAIVKSRVRDAILPRTKRYIDNESSDERQDRLMSDSSQWCIEALFERSDQ